jgi:hypothetical protein
VADEREAAGQEPLTEREREALTMLARELVREAGIANDPEAKAEEKRKEDLMEAIRANREACPCCVTPLRLPRLRNGT